MPNELKPMIRHCRNCEYLKTSNYGDIRDGVCMVKYKFKDCTMQRISALFCRFFKQKEPNQ